MTCDCEVKYKKDYSKKQKKKLKKLKKKKKAKKYKAYQKELEMKRRTMGNLHYTPRKVNVVYSGSVSGSSTPNITPRYIPETRAQTLKSKYDSLSKNTLRSWDKIHKMASAAVTPSLQKDFKDYIEYLQYNP